MRNDGILKKDEIVMYNVKDITKIFNCGITHAYELVNSKGFPSIKVGGRFLVERTALEKWMEKHQGKTFLIS